MFNLLRKKDGNVTILVSVMLFAIMGIMALVVDMGVVYAEKAKLSKAIDAAILAGGQELPDNKVKAKTIMEQYLVENGVDLSDVTITIDADGLGAQIVGNKTVDNAFAKLIGIDTSDISERSKIVLGTAGSARGGLRPFGVEQYDFTYGDSVVLKKGAGDGYNGNYGPVALGGTGTQLLEYNALFGYDGVVNVGDVIPTEPGNMASMVMTLASYMDSIPDTFDNYERGSDRIWTVPIVDSLDVSGRDGTVVVGFAQLFVEDVFKRQGNAEIHGRFIRYVTNGEIDNTLVNMGSYGMKLVD